MPEFATGYSLRARFSPCGVASASSLTEYKTSHFNRVCGINRLKLFNVLILKGPLILVFQRVFPRSTGGQTGLPNPNLCWDANGIVGQAITPPSSLLS